MVDALTVVELAGLVIGFPIVAYLIGAVVHIWIDQRASTRLKDQFFKTTREQIVDPLEGRITAKLDALEARVAIFEAPEAPDVGPQLSAWLHTEDGQSWGRAIVEGVAASFKERTGSLRGNLGRREQSSLYQVIRPAIDKALQTGNPATDVIVGLIPSELKDQAAVRLTRVLRKVLHENPGMLTQFQDAEYEVLDEEQGEQPEPPALGDGNLDGYA